MKAWIAVTLACLAATARAEPVELELGIGGSPAGIVGIRSIVRVGDYDTGLAAGTGLGLTGLIGAIGVDQPVYHVHAKLDLQYSLYASYALGYLAPWSREPFGSHEEWMRDGFYHWLDAGVAVRAEGSRFYIGAGFGAAFLVKHPEPIGVDMVEDEDLLWWLFPDGWTRQQGWGPVIWSNVGWRL